MTVSIRILYGVLFTIEHPKLLVFCEQSCPPPKKMDQKTIIEWEYWTHTAAL